jgi:large repetitive protein
MAGVISGNGLGWFNGSMTQLGRSLGGRAGIGQSNESAYVNIANGNLVLSGRDEQMQFRNLGLDYVRTYNSQGVASAGADGWLFGFESKIKTVFVGKSFVVDYLERTGDDGSVVRYSASATTGVYVSSVGEGAHDKITVNSLNGNYAWTEGSSGIVETFNKSGGLISRQNRVGTTWTFVRDAANELFQINGSGYERIDLNRDASGRITGIDTRDSTQGFAHSVEYSYDTQGRLAQVRTNLKPGPIYQSEFFSTDYAYFGNTQQIQSLTQSDGVKTSFTYDASGRVTSVTLGNAALNDGTLAQTTTYNYSAAQTTVSVGSESWIYKYDAGNQLTEVQSVVVDGQRMVTHYGYDSLGNLSFTEQGKIVPFSPYVVTERMDYTYDARGNLESESNLLGNLVLREYNAQNQLTSLTQFTDSETLVSRFIYDAQSKLRFEIDATGAVKEYVYDATGAGGAGGAVLVPSSGTDFGSPAPGQVRRTVVTLTERYSGLIDLASVEAWAAQLVLQNSAQSVVDYTYDWRGLLMFEERYAQSSQSTIDFETDGFYLNESGRIYLDRADAAAVFIGYSYDRQGLLAQQRVYRGAERDQVETNNFGYDGMGRLLNSTISGNGLAARTTTSVYDDANNRLVTTMASGLVRTEARNSLGNVLSVMESGNVGFAGGAQTRTTQNFYNARGQLIAVKDENNALNYFFYDDAGRLETEVDATGAVTRHSFKNGDASDARQVISSRQYANLISTAGWYNQASNTVTLPTTVAVSVNSAKDRVSSSTYNLAGQLEQIQDAEGTKTRYEYDGAGRLLLTQRISVDGSEGVREARNAYDAAGRIVATLDAGNYITRMFYDAGGRLVKTIAFADAIDPAQFQSSGQKNFDQPLDASRDQVTRFYYNAKGELIGTFDAERYLTVRLLSEEAHTVRTVRYAAQFDSSWGDVDASLEELSANLGSQIRQESETVMNAAGEVKKTTRAGMISIYSYDTSGRLIRTLTFDDSSPTQASILNEQVRYNAFGEVVQTLRPEGAALITAGMTTTQIDAIWAQWAMSYDYNALGQRIESRDQAGNKTWYFYDKEGRLAFTAQGHAVGTVLNAEIEVNQSIYSAFGDTASTLAFTGRLAIGAPDGPYEYAQAAAVINTISASTATKNRVDYSYNKRGQLLSESDPRNASAAKVTTNLYNGFGDLKQTTLAAAINGVVNSQSISTFSYDARGLQISTSTALAATAITTTQHHDAFGRVQERIDARGQTITLSYDRLGRQVSLSQSVNSRIETNEITYDAFDRVLTQTDAMGRITTYQYNPTGVFVEGTQAKMTTPEGVTLTTLRNRRGMTLQTTDGNNVKTSYRYDLDGQLKTVTASDGTAIASTSTNTYDKRGLLFESTDPTGITTRLSYDSAGRVLSRTESANGLNLTATYEYDGQGQQIKMTDASGKMTTMVYDQAGNVLSVVRGDLNDEYEISTFTYDAQGQQLSVTEGDSRTTAYIYDAAGRRIEEIIDPTGLKISTQYQYDENGNVVLRGNAKYASGSSASSTTPDGVTRYVYDEANRLIYMVDQNNSVSQLCDSANARRWRAQPKPGAKRIDQQRYPGRTQLLGF